MNIILKKPIISEKSMKLTNNGLFTFLVDKQSTKSQIAKIVADKFKVDVISVKTINVKSEVKMQRRVRKTYSTPSFKKAMVQLKKGQKIALFETTPEDEATVTTAEGKPQVLREKKDILRRTKVKVERGDVGSAPSTQRKVIPT